MPATSLIDLLRAPESAARLTGGQWNDVILQGRKNQLLGQMAALLERHGCLAAVPAAVQRHLRLELLTAKRRGESALWELATIRRTINPVVSIAVLKGCAYVAAGDVNHTGRSFSDVDLMVEHTLLPRVETELIGEGWKPGAVDAYDAAYYRNWMHEVPPMEHVRRHTVLDLHHAINPPISRCYVDPAMLRAAMVEILPGVCVLSPLDRVVHCALHLIQEGESKKLLRDLFDLHLLAQQHCPAEMGRRHLIERAAQLGVKPQVQAALGAAERLFAPVAVANSPSSLLKTCLFAASQQGLGRVSISGLVAEWSIWAYSHWIKMPLPVLIPHLMRKAGKAMAWGKRDKP